MDYFIFRILFISLVAMCLLSALSADAAGLKDGAAAPVDREAGTDGKDAQSAVGRAGWCTIIGVSNSIQIKHVT